MNLFSEVWEMQNKLHKRQIHSYKVQVSLNP
jgi:hypothetical protein